MIKLTNNQGTRVGSRDWNLLLIFLGAKIQITFYKFVELLFLTPNFYSC